MRARELGLRRDLRNVLYRYFMKSLDSLRKRYLAVFLSFKKIYSTNFTHLLDLNLGLKYCIVVYITLMLFIFERTGILSVLPFG